MLWMGLLQEKGISTTRWRGTPKKSPPPVDADATNDNNNNNNNKRE